MRWNAAEMPTTSGANDSLRSKEGQLTLQKF